MIGTALMGQKREFRRKIGYQKHVAVLVLGTMYLAMMIFTQTYFQNR